MARPSLLHASSLVLLALVACSAPASEWPGDADPRPVRGGGRVLHEGASITFTFPALPLAETGCAELDDGGRGRRFYWLATLRKPDGEGSNDFMQTGVHFYLPDTAAVTAPSLERALRSQALAVTHARGEPPMPTGRWVPERASARLEQGRVVIRVSDEAAVREFLAWGVRTVSLGWCERGESLTWVDVPVLSRP